MATTTKRRPQKAAKDIESNGITISLAETRGNLESLKSRLKPDELTEETLKALSKRCKSLGVEVREHKRTTDEEPRYLFLKSQLWKEPEHLLIDKESEAQALLNTDFEVYSFIPGFDAIWSQKACVIECAVSYRARRILRGVADEFVTNQSDRKRVHKIKIADSLTQGKDIAITLGFASLVFEALTYSLGDENLTLRLEGIEAQEVEDAKRILIRASDSFFLQCDLKFGVYPELRREDDSEALEGPAVSDESAVLHFPVMEFEEQPLSLYRYARANTELPLVEFLGYYHVCEHYFTRHGQPELRSRFLKSLKDVRYAPLSEGQIDLLINVAREVQRDGSEEEQLKTTIRAVVTKEELTKFIQSHTESQEFWRDNKNVISMFTINLSNTGQDIRDQVAARIYDIRCMIAHAKSDGGKRKTASIDPYSDRAAKLGRDIALARFLATRCLIEASERRSY